MREKNAVILPVPYEYEEQVALMQWAEWNKPWIPELEAIYAIPNGEKRNAITGARLKRSGTKRGVPDLCLPVPRGG